MPDSFRENKEKTISIRIGSTEYEYLKRRMEQNNYKSMSKFVRDAIFKHYISERPTRNLSEELIKEFTDVLNVPIHHDGPEPISLKQYIKTHDDAYTAFTALFNTALSMMDF